MRLNSKRGTAIRGQAKVSRPIARLTRPTAHLRADHGLDVCVCFSGSSHNSRSQQNLHAVFGFLFKLFFPSISLRRPLRIRPPPALKYNK